MKIEKRFSLKTRSKRQEKTAIRIRIQARRSRGGRPKEPHDRERRTHTLTHTHRQTNNVARMEPLITFALCAASELPLPPDSRN